MPIFTDQTGNRIDLPATPLRIISLVPSQTELLYDLGLEEEVVGITKFCIHPDSWFRQKTRVGGTKQLKMEIIHRLKPDLIIANKEENVKEQVEELAQHYRVWVSDINNLADAYAMISTIGELTRRDTRANQLVKDIKAKFAAMGQFSIKKACYLIWQNPMMTVGGDTFIHSMLELAGFYNVYGAESRYPETDIVALKKIQPGCLLLASEPFPFKEKHKAELEKALPDTRVLLVNGELFSWYGSRLLKAPAYFEELQQQMK